MEQRGDTWHLMKGLDASKDQSYVLFTLRQQELSRTLLPVGWYAKPRIREFALEAGLPVADKPDSQEICFIPDTGYREFIKERVTSTPGDIVDSSGNVLARHNGIANFTVGQRKGLGVHSATPLYVVGVNAERHQVVVGGPDELMQDTLLASRINFPSGTPSGPVRVTAKIRYKASEADATLYPRGEDAVIQFDQPQRAVTPGQAVAFYQGDDLLGGGIIEGAYAFTGGPVHSAALSTAGS